MVTDVVGFSRLMEADEAGTMAALKDRRKAVFEPTVREYGGRIVKLMGDGALVEFASAVDAVNGAVQLQRRMAQANAGLPEERRIVLRIGINIGDVIGEGSDIYGEGVNVAARLEALAQGGGLCISAKVHEEIIGKVEFSFADAGEQQLKNIARPVRTFRFDPDTTEGPTTDRPAAKSGRPSIAILPFANIGGDAEQQPLCDGITEDIITELSRFRQLRVASRNSSARFAGGNVDMIRAGRELGVGYLVEGSLRRMGARVRITAQLINAASGDHVWADRYDIPQEDIFEVQDRVVRTIVGTLCGRMNAADLDIAMRKPTASLAASDLVLRGDAIPWTTRENEAEARRLFRQAIELDPGHARAHALLSFSLSREWLCDMSGSDELLEESHRSAVRAVALDDNDTLCQLAMVWAHVYRGSHEMAEPHLAKALALNPNQPSTQTDLAVFQNCIGESDKAIETFLSARRLDPLFTPSWYWGELGAAYFNAHRYDDAIASMRRSTELSNFYRAWLAAAYAYAGDPAMSRACADELLTRIPAFSVNRFTKKGFLVRPEDRDHLAAGLRAAGLE